MEYTSIRDKLGSRDKLKADFDNNYTIIMMIS